MGGAPTRLPFVASSPMWFLPWKQCDKIRGWITSTAQSRPLLRWPNSYVFAAEEMALWRTRCHLAEKDQSQDQDEQEKRADATGRPTWAGLIVNRTAKLHRDGTKIT